MDLVGWTGWAGPASVDHPSLKREGNALWEGTWEGGGRGGRWAVGRCCTLDAGNLAVDGLGCGGEWELVPPVRM